MVFNIGGYHYTLIPALVLFSLLAYASIEAFRGRIRLAKRVYRDAAIAAIVAWLIYTIPFVIRDYTLEPVYESTSVGLPWWLLPATAWSTGGGSLFLFAVFAAVGGYLVARSLENRWYLILSPWISAIVIIDAWMYGAFDLNPHPEATGMGLNPLLKSIWIYPHPLTTFGGYALLAVASLALALGEKSRATRMVFNVGWALLTLGIMLGGLWSYETFGWGGYWAWDPVETSELMVWLAATTIPHMLVAAEVLAAPMASTTISTIYLAMFVTRGGLSALHSFALPDIAADILLAVSIAWLVYAAYQVAFADYRRLVSQVRMWVKTPFNFGMGLAAISLAYAALLLTSVLMSASLLAALGNTSVTVPQMEQGVNFFNPRLYPAAFLLLAGIAIAFLGDRLGWRGSAALILATSLVAGLYALYAYETRALAPYTPSETNAVMAAGIVFSSVTLASVIVYLGERIWRALKTSASMIARDRYIGIALIHLGFALVLLGVFVGGTYSFNDSYLLEFHLKPGDVLVLPGGKKMIFESFSYGITETPVDIYTPYVCKSSTYYAAQQSLLTLHMLLQPFVAGMQLYQNGYRELLMLAHGNYTLGNIALCSGCKADMVAIVAGGRLQKMLGNVTLNITLVDARIRLRIEETRGPHGNMTVAVPFIDAKTIVVELREAAKATLNTSDTSRMMIRVLLSNPVNVTLGSSTLSISDFVVFTVRGHVEVSGERLVYENGSLGVIDAVLYADEHRVKCGLNNPLPASVLTYIRLSWLLENPEFNKTIRDLLKSGVAKLLTDPMLLLRAVTTEHCPCSETQLQTFGFCMGFLNAPRYVPENSYLRAIFRFVDEATGRSTKVTALVRFEVNGEVQGIHGSVPKVLHAPLGLTDVYIVVYQPKRVINYTFPVVLGSELHWYTPYSDIGGVPELIIYYLHEAFKEIKDPVKKLSLAALLAAGLKIEAFRSAFRGEIPFEFVAQQAAYDALALYMEAEKFNMSNSSIYAEGVIVDVKLVPGAPLVWWGSVIMAAAAILSAAALYASSRGTG